MAEFHIDQSEWPVVVIRYPEWATPEEIQSYIDTLGRIAEREPIVAIVDVGGVDVSKVTSTQRKSLADAIDAISAQGRLRAEAVIVESTVLRGMVTAYSWLRQAKHPFRTFPNLEQAMRWAKALVREVQMTSTGKVEV